MLTITNALFKGSSVFKRFYKSPLNYTSKFEVMVPSADSLPTFRLCLPDGAVTDESQIPTELLNKERLTGIYEQMVLTNTMDQILYDAQRQGRVSFYMTCYGEEATHFGSAAALSKDDMIYAQYREVGVLLYRGFGVQQCLHQMYGNVKDLGKGRQMPIHYGSRELNYQTISSPLGTQLPQAVGTAYKYKLDNKMSSLKRVAVCYFGEGAASEGDFHAALNMAATLKTPVLFFCRNNEFAISTHHSEQYAGDGIAARGPGYGIPTIRVDGNDLFAVYKTVKEARELAIKESTPVLIEAITYRVGHHSTSDDSSAYRPKTEAEERLNASSPLVRLRRFLEQRKWWNDAKEDSHRLECRKQVLEAMKAAESLPKPPITELFNDVYDELTPKLREQRAQLEALIAKYPEHYGINAYAEDVQK